MRTSYFGSVLAEHRAACEFRPERWRYVAYDQLHQNFLPPDRQTTGVLFVETPDKARRRPYHQQKLCFVLANQRHFALETAATGFAVRYCTGDTLAEVLAALVSRHGPLETIRAAERETRLELQPLIQRQLISELAHPGWLTSESDFLRAVGDRPPWRMDTFYRAVRKQQGILMESDRPVGGKFSFDADNRRPWKGAPSAPQPPRYPIDPIRAEVAELIRKSYSHHPGQLDPGAIPCTRQEALAHLRWAESECLPHFGPFEDAMHSASSGLFHSRLSPLINSHRLLPREVLDVAIRAPIPLPSKEGFVRQILGWREFVRHAHELSDGFADTHLEKGEPLPPAYWGKESGLNCLDHVVQTVWREGWSHHITRLMVLSNIATLMGYSPRELSDWFWCAYIDAYDWVVEPNVLAMGTYAVRDLTTKPYVSGAAYIAKMSDYCRSCHFDPKSNCPLTSLYWGYLERHRDNLADNQRMSLPLASLRKRPDTVRSNDRKLRDQILETLAAGRKFEP